MNERTLPVVFVHSLAGTPEQWVYQVTRFAPHREVVAVALPGHAGQPEPEAYTFETLADGIARQTRPFERFVLVGHSAGAVASVAFTARHPGPVAGLVLVDPGTDGRGFPPEQAEPFLAALRSDRYAETAERYWSQILKGAKPATRERVMAGLRAAPRGALPDILDTLRHFDAVTPLRAYAAEQPVLIIATPLSDGDGAFHEVVPEVEHVRLKGTSHWVQLDRPEAVNEALDEFLQRIH